jgi:hypothetical protein
MILAMLSGQNISIRLDQVRNMTVTLVIEGRIPDHQNKYLVPNLNYSLEAARAPSSPPQVHAKSG